MISFNGIGTKLYGKRDFNQADQSYIATKWLIILFLPIIPLASYRVTKVKQKFFTFESPQYVWGKVNTNWRQILNTYAAVWGTVITLVILTVLFS